MPEEPDNDEFRQWKLEEEAHGREIRFHDYGPDGATFWQSWEGDEWCDLYYDRRGKRIVLGYLEVE